MAWDRDDLETVACDACGSTSFAPLFRRPDGLALGACRACGLAFLNPRPRPREIRRLYSDRYFVKPGEKADIGWNDYFAPANLEAVRTLAGERLRLVLGAGTLSGLRILEIGCASGEVCGLLAERGADVVGLDISADVIRRARLRFPGLRFREGDVAALPEAPFDVILAFEVLEHTTSPVAFLKAAARRLAPGGLFAMTTPNVAYGRRVGFGRWTGSVTSFEHLYFFEPGTLERCGVQAGLSLVDWYGRGGGRVAQPPGGARGAAQALLGWLGLLTMSRSFRRRLSGSPAASSGYVRHGPGHNLLAVFRKTPAVAAAVAGRSR